MVRKINSSIRQRLPDAFGIALSNFSLFVASTTIALSVATFVSACIFGLLQLELGKGLQILLFWLVMSVALYRTYVALRDMRVFRSNSKTLSRPMRVSSHIFGVAILCFAVALVCLHLDGMNLLLSVGDGANHLSILNGLEVDRTRMIMPRLVSELGMSIDSTSPYPVGSHLLIWVIGETAGVSSGNAYEIVVRVFEVVVFPFSLCLLYRVAYGKELSLLAGMAVLAIGYVWRPVPESFQSPTTLSIPIALIGSAIWTGNQRLSSWIFGVSMLALPVAFFHPSSMLLLVLISMRLRQARFFRAYSGAVVATGMAYLAVRNLVNAGKYFESWVTANVTDEVMFDAAEFAVRGTNFLLLYVFGMGRDSPLAIMLGVLSIAVLIAGTRQSTNGVGFTLMLLISTAFTGFATIGQYMAILTYPWYGTPARFVALWTSVLVICAAESLRRWERVGD